MNMDAKEYLEQYNSLDRIAARCLAEYKAESEAISNLLPYYKQYAKKIDALTLYAQGLKVRSEEISSARDEVLSVINSIPGLEKDVLRSRYVDQMIWDDIAEKYCYSNRGIWYLHDRALKMLQEKLDEMENTLQT